MKTLWRLLSILAVANLLALSAFVDFSCEPRLLIVERLHR